MDAAPITTTSALSGSAMEPATSPRGAGRRRTASRAVAPSSSTSSHRGRSRRRARRAGAETLEPRDLRLGIFDPDVHVHGGLARRDDVDALDEQAGRGSPSGGAEHDVGVPARTALIAERLLPERGRRIGVDRVHHDLDRGAHATVAAPRLRRARAPLDERPPDPERPLVVLPFLVQLPLDAEHERRRAGHLDRLDHPVGGPRDRLEALPESRRSPGGGSCRPRSAHRDATRASSPAGSSIGCVGCAGRSRPSSVASTRARHSSHFAPGWSAPPAGNSSRSPYSVRRTRRSGPGTRGRPRAPARRPRPRGARSAARSRRGAAAPADASGAAPRARTATPRCRGRRRARARRAARSARPGPPPARSTAAGPGARRRRAAAARTRSRSSRRSRRTLRRSPTIGRGRHTSLNGRRAAPSPRARAGASRSRRSRSPPPTGPSSGWGNFACWAFSWMP